jgi:hypothetical protein
MARTPADACVHVCCRLCADYQPGSALPVSSSAIAIGEDFEVYTPKVRSFLHNVVVAVASASKSPHCTSNNI